MEAIIGACILGIITGLIAKRKGYSFWGWFFGGSFLAIIFLPWAIFMRTTDEELVRRLEVRGIAVDRDTESESPSAPLQKYGRPFGFVKILVGGIVVVFALALLQSHNFFEDLLTTSGTSDIPTAAATSSIMSTPPQHFEAASLKAMFKKNNLRTESEFGGKVVDVTGAIGNIKSEYGHMQVTLTQNYEWNTVFYGVLADNQKQTAVSLSSGYVVTLRCVLQDTILDTPRGGSCIILQ